MTINETEEFDEFFMKAFGEVLETPGLVHTRAEALLYSRLHLAYQQGRKDERAAVTRRINEFFEQFPMASTDEAMRHSREKLG